MSALRQIFATFGVEFDTQQLEEGNKKIEEGKKRLREFGTAVLEAFAVEKVAEFTLGMAEQAEQLEHNAQATGLSTDELQAWQLGASEAGVEGDEFTMALRRLSTSMAGGADAAGSQAKVFAELGIKTKDAHGSVRGLVDVLPEIVEHFKNTKDGAGKAALATELFGRQGARLIPLLNKGADGIVDLRQKLKLMGGGFSPEFIKASAELIEDTKELAEGWTSLKVKIAGYLIPALDGAVRVLTKVVVWMGNLVQQTNIVTAALVAFGLKGALALTELAVANAPLLAEFGLMALGIGLVVLAIDELITTWQGGDSLITRGLDKIFGEGSTAKAVAWIHSIADGFGEMFATAKDNATEFDSTWEKSLDDIRDDFEGTFGGAYIGGLLAGLEDAFFATIKALSGGWQGFWDFMSGMVDALLFSFDVVWDDIKYAGLGVAAALSDAFDKFVSHLGPIGDLAKKLGIDLGAGGGGASDALAADRTRNTTARVAQAQDIDDRIRGHHVEVNAPVTVNVPAGTPAATANAAGHAARRGAEGAHRKAAHALVQGSG